MMLSATGQAAKLPFDVTLLKKAPASSGPTLDDFLRSSQQLEVKGDLSTVQRSLDKQESLRDLARNIQKAVGSQSVTLEGLSWALKKNAADNGVKAESLMTEAAAQTARPLSRKLTEVASKTLHHVACITGALSLNLGAAVALGTLKGHPLPAALFTSPLSVGFGACLVSAATAVCLWMNADSVFKTDAKDMLASADRTSFAATRQTTLAHDFDDWQAKLK